MPEDDDIAYLILHRMTWRNLDLMPGSTVVIANCGHRAWIAPSSQRWQETPRGAEAYTICTSCMPKDLMTSEETVLDAVPGSNEEFVRHMTGSQAEALQRYLAFLERGR